MRLACHSLAAVCAAGLFDAPAVTLAGEGSAFTQGVGLLPGPGWCRPARDASDADVTVVSVYASRQAMIRVLGELYLLAREDRHRRSSATWRACASLAQQLGCSTEFCRVLADMARDDLSARERADRRTEMGRLIRAQRVDELALRQWVELMPLPPKGIRQAMDTLPLGNLFWADSRGGTRAYPSRTQVPGTSSLLDELLGVMDEQVTVLSRVRDTESANLAAAQLLPVLLHLQAVRASMRRHGLMMMNLEASAAQQERFASLRQSLVREWSRLREAGFYDSADLVVMEALVAVC